MLLTVFKRQVCTRRHEHERTLKLIYIVTDVCFQLNEIATKLIKDLNELIVQSDKPVDTRHEPFEKPLWRILTVS